jgi:hypothetical protein
MMLCYVGYQYDSSLLFFFVLLWSQQTLFVQEEGEEGALRINQQSKEKYCSKEKWW